MALNTAPIEKRLGAASWSERDNEAQALIAGACPADLKGLDAEGVPMQHETMRMQAPRIHPTRGPLAVKRLATESQFVASHLAIRDDVSEVVR